MSSPARAHSLCAGGIDVRLLASIVVKKPAKLSKGMPGQAEWSSSASACRFRRARATLLTVPATLPSVSPSSAFHNGPPRYVNRNPTNSVAVCEASAVSRHNQAEVKRSLPPNAAHGDVKSKRARTSADLLREQFKLSNSRLYGASGSSSEPAQELTGKTSIAAKMMLT